MVDFVKAIRDDRGFEIGWYCNDCDEPSTSLWQGRCKKCQRSHERHLEILALLKKREEK